MSKIVRRLCQITSICAKDKRRIEESSTLWSQVQPTARKCWRKDGLCDPLKKEGLQILILCVEDDWGDNWKRPHLVIRAYERQHQYLSSTLASIFWYAELASSPPIWLCTFDTGSMPLKYEDWEYGSILRSRYKFCSLHVASQPRCSDRYLSRPRNHSSSSSRRLNYILRSRGDRSCSVW